MKNPKRFETREGDLRADLRRRIISLELPPGTALSRQQLQEQYALSSTPIRDALLQLQEEGLVAVQPQSRTCVTLIDGEQARQAHFLRSTIEREIATCLAHSAGPELHTTLDRLVRLQEDVATQDLDLFAQLDHDFHQELFIAAGLEHVHDAIRRESIHIDRIRALHLPMGDKTARILDDHRRIAGALRAGSAEQAGAAMAQHLSQSIGMAAKLRKLHPDYFLA
ncbi:DNA-binding transcriptional regulator, GntR family [Paracoccus alcaliphilus]|uniref:DNA-binding transcriptional regulator, GntR family n=1 Tax=Paracoccus alcaliphilus TaxID=34002 RepID=A0A1H8EWK3_9RHOB|nr:GntR family transcriptional regulator [Paracoccus alcaliphilus]SEN23756.1 DNA-binding transcriptional regulator, GntR family [Paracoccus alcaliphilus]